MREIRIYQAGIYHVGEQWELTPEASQHVGTVLRMRQGSLLTLFDGTNKEYDTQIVEVRKKSVLVQIDAMREVSRESPVALHLAQAISKGDRMEWVVQKAVELGVASITPLITARCAVKLDEERMIKKRNQWQAIAIAACEQCGRNQIPEIFNPVILAPYLKNVESSFKLILHPQGNKSWREYDFNGKSISLLVGPEGGLNEDEVQLAMTHGFTPLALGPRILRTETAAISALSILQAAVGDL